MKNFKVKWLLLSFILSIASINTTWADWYLSGPTAFGGYEWGTQNDLKMSSSGISNWVYKSLQPGGEWAGFKVTDGSTWYGKNSSNVEVGTEYTPSSSGSADPNYCDFSQYASMPYYFFFNTSTKKLMIQPNYYLAGDCGATDQGWATDKNTNTYDATNGYFKWNTMSLTAGSKYAFKLTNGQGTAWTYTFADWSGVTVTQGNKDSENSGNIEFTPTYGGTAVIVFVPTTNNMVIHCPYQVSYNKGANGTGTISSGSKTWKTSFTLSSSTFTRAGYTQDGWSTSDGGTKVYELGGSYSTDADITLYPHWTENMSSVSLVASPSAKGSFTIGGAAATSTTAGVTTTRSVTAVPISGYHFVSWSITGGASISSTSTNPTTVTGGGAGTAATLTATFAADDVYTLTVATGTGISAVSGTTNDIKAAQEIAISATVATGYTWSTWTKTGAGTLSTFTAGTKNQTVIVGTAGDITLTASATENKSSLTTSNHYDAGNPSYSVPSKSVSSIGITTTADLTASTPSTGYRFAGWTLSNNLVVTSGDKDTDLSITVRTNGNGAAATAQANYEEDLTTDWKLIGDNQTGSPFGDNYTYASGKAMSKKSGASTTNKAYKTLNVTKLPAENYGFKAATAAGDSYSYGWGSSDGYYVTYNRSKSGIANDVYTGSQHQLLFVPDALGEYEFEVDYTATPCSIKVTFPATTYAINFGKGSGTAGSVSATYSSTSFSTGTKVQNGKSITLTAPSASSGFSWDGWYDASSGGSKVSSDNPLTTTVSSTNCNFYARYTEATYTVTFNDGDHGTVSPSGDQSVGAGGKSITATPDEGYMFTEWSKTGDNVSLSSTTDNPTTVTASGTGSVTANYAERYILCGAIDADGNPEGGMAGWSATSNSSYTSWTCIGSVLTIHAALTSAETIYKFKVVDRLTDTWHGQTGSSTITASAKWTLDGNNDVKMQTTVAGNYTFVIDFSGGSDPEVSIAYPGDFICGDFTNWGVGQDNIAFDDNGEATVELDEGDHEFKIIYNNKWYGNGATIDGTTLDQPLLTPGSNCTISVPEGRETYLFMWDAANTKLSIFTSADAAKAKLTKNKYVYCDARGNSNWQADAFNARFWFKNFGSGANIGSVTCNATDTLDDWVYYAQVPNNDFVGRVQMNRLNPSGGAVWTTSGLIHAYSRSSANQNCMVVDASTNNLTWGTYCPPMSSNTLADDGTTLSWGGDGSFETPYLIPTGASIKVKSTATKAVNDDNMTIYYQFKKANTAQGSASSTATKTITASGTTGTKEAVKVEAYNTYNSTEGKRLTSNEIYYEVRTPYTISYNKGTNGTGTRDSETKLKGVNFTLPSSAVFTRTGYTQTKWSTADGSGTQYNLGGSYTTDAAQAFYPVWTANQYTITLNDRDATTASSTSATLKATYDSNTLTATITNPTKTGYTFAGWYTNSDGTGDKIIDEEGALVAGVTGYTDASKNWKYTTGDLNLYARWKANATVSAYNFQYGSGTYYSSSWTVVNFGSATSHKRTADFTMPDPTNKMYYVGYNGDFWGSSLGEGETKSMSVETNLSALPMTPSGDAIGNATGAVGKLVIYDNYDDDNLYVRFEPSGYAVNYNSKTEAFHATPTEHLYETDVVTIVTADLSATFKVQLKTSSSYVDCGNTVSEAKSAVGNNSEMANGVTGRFYIWINSTDDNFALFFKSCNNYFQTAGDWSNVSNWSLGNLPTIDDAVYIQKAVNVDIANAKAKSVLIDQSSSNTGKLTVASNGALVVATTIQKKDAGGSNVATEETDIILESDGTYGTGALVAGSASTTTKATVHFYSKAKKDGSGNYINQYFGIPADSVSKLNYYGSYLQKYDQPTDSWVSFTEESKMGPWTAYRILREETSEGTYEVSGTLLLPGIGDGKTKTLTLNTSAGHDNDNMFANSWAAPIDITKLDTENDFVGATATIYIFNAGSAADYSTYGGSTTHKDARAGQWIELPVRATMAVPTDYDLNVIPSQQAFLVQATSGSGEHSLKLDYEKLVYNPIKANGATITPTRAPRHEQANDLEIVRLFMTGESGLGDRVLMYVRDDFSADEMDNGWEAYKLPGSEFAPQLCAYSGLGEMSISATNVVEGTVLGFYAGTEDSEYTFTFDYEGEQVWYLNDLEAQQSTLINAASAYNFSAVPGTVAERRFVISHTPIAHVPTGIDNSEAVEGTQARKQMINGILYIIRSGKIYSTDGQIVK